jgi:hypothetical protein
LIIPNKLRELRRRVQGSSREFHFRRAVRQISAAAATEMPKTKLVWQLFAAWGNQSYSADPEYLEDVVRRAATTCEQ